MSEDLTDFIKSHAFGVPQLRPDEKRAFLGNFRERVAMAVTVRQLHSEQIYDLLASVLTRYPQYRIYLNGRMPQELVTTYMQQALAHDYPFTIMAQSGCGSRGRLPPMILAGCWPAQRRKSPGQFYCEQ